MSRGTKEEGPTYPPYNIKRRRRKEGGRSAGLARMEKSETVLRHEGG